MQETRVKTISGWSLMMALITFLTMWGGVVLLLTNPGGPQLPLHASSPRAMMISLLLFWLPAGSGAIACLSGLAGLASAGKEQLEVRRRAVVAILLGMMPICLAAGWLGWALARSVP